MNMRKTSTNRSLSRLKRNASIVSKFGVTIVTIIVASLAIVLYRDITEQNLANYCYAFFAGNAIAANCMFSLGRSNVFIERHPNQTKVYFSGVYFLIAAILGLILSAAAYIETRPGITFLENISNKDISLFAYSVFLIFGAVLSFVAIIFFSRWIKDEIGFSKEK
jgi:hypothetical protein